MYSASVVDNVTQACLEFKRGGGGEGEIKKVFGKI